MDTYCWYRVCCDCVWVSWFDVYSNWDDVTMIRFMFGFILIVAGVGAIEGTAGLATGAILALVGITTMFWGIKGMANKGDLA